MLVPESVVEVLMDSIFREDDDKDHYSTKTWCDKRNIDDPIERIDEMAI